MIEQRLLDCERLKAREKLSQTEKQLSGILYERGIDNKGFAIIRSKGDQALFNLSTQMLKKRMNVPTNRPIADFLPTISIKAKDLAAEMTNVNCKRRIYMDNLLLRKNILITTPLFVICYCKGELSLNNFPRMRILKRYSVE